MNITMKMLISDFIEGKEEGISGTKSTPGNLKIHKNQLIHFNTPILERCNAGYVLNMTRYSIQTGRLQKLIMEMIKVENIVTKVPMDYKGTLLDFIEE